MREELKDMEVNDVKGGSVILSQPLNVCGFSAIGRMFRIKGDFKVMRNRLFELMDEHMNMKAEEFDTLVMNEFKANGWI